MTTGLNLNDLFRNHRIAPEQILVLRHRPHEAELNKVLPWLAAEEPEVFNAYQQVLEGGEVVMRDLLAP